MQIYTDILGPAAMPAIADALHRLEHADAVDWLILPRADLSRRRLRARTSAGQDVAVMLARETPLFDGAVLRLDAKGALVVRVEAEEWLRLRPADPGAALRLGYLCGNLHWRVRFEAAEVLVAVERPLPTYLDRLAGLLEAGAVARVAAP